MDSSETRFKYDLGGGNRFVWNSVNCLLTLTAKNGVV